MDHELSRILAYLDGHETWAAERLAERVSILRDRLNEAEAAFDRPVDPEWLAGASDECVFGVLAAVSSSRLIRIVSGPCGEAVMRRLTLAEPTNPLVARHRAATITRLAAAARYRLLRRMLSKERFDNAITGIAGEATLEGAA